MNAVDSSGNRGLGVTPSAWFTSNNTKAMQLGGGSFVSYLNNQVWLANNYFLNSSGQDTYVNNGAAMRFIMDGAYKFQIAPSGTAGNAITFTQAMTLDASGNLLLGATTGSGFKTRIQDDSLQVRLQAATNTNQGLTLGYTYSGGYGQINCDEAGVNQKDLWYTALSHKFGRNTSVQYMVLDASGNLGIGTTSPLMPIQVSNYGGLDGNANTFIVRNNVYYDVVDARKESIKAGFSTEIELDNDSGFICFRTTSSSAAGANVAVTTTERARITSGGSFCVHDGTVVESGLVSFAKTTETTPVLTIKNPQYSCDMWATNTSGDNIWVRFFSEASATQRGSIAYNRLGGLVAYNTTSDYRAKDIFGPVTNAGATIDALKVYTGKMKGATVERPMLVAHEAQAVTPYAVTGEKDAVDEDGKPKYQQMDVSSLVPLLIAEIQSLRARVAQLEQGA
jgi:hypothetical protein